MPRRQGQARPAGQLARTPVHHGAGAQRVVPTQVEQNADDGGNADALHNSRKGYRAGLEGARQRAGGRDSNEHPGQRPAWGSTQPGGVRLGGKALGARPAQPAAAGKRRRTRLDSATA